MHPKLPTFRIDSTSEEMAEKLVTFAEFERLIALKLARAITPAEFEAEFERLAQHAYDAGKEDRRRRKEDNRNAGPDGECA